MWKLVPNYVRVFLTNSQNCQVHNIDNPKVYSINLSLNTFFSFLNVAKLLPFLINAGVFFQF